MKTCSEFIKSCGFKSTRQVANLNNKCVRTIERAYNDDKYAFGDYLIEAANQINKSFMFEVKRKLKSGFAQPDTKESDNG